MSMHCMGCDADVQPAIDIGENGRPRSVCPKCQQVLGSAMAATDQPEPEPEPVLQVQPGPDSVQRTKGGRLVAALPTLQPADLVQSARDRLAVIDTELSRLAGLQREHRRLTAMIQAADLADQADAPTIATAAEYHVRPAQHEEVP